MVAGGLIGYVIDAWRNLRPFSPRRWEVFPQDRAQAVFLAAVFAVLGRVAKLDGHVSKREIQVAEEIMRELAVTGSQRELAIELFSRGKGAYLPYRTLLRRLRQFDGGPGERRRRFLRYQLRMGFADGPVRGDLRSWLGRCAALLGIAPEELDGMLRQRRYRAEAPRDEDDKEDQLTRAYNRLGVAPDVRDNELKQAYRRLISRNHPDRLVAGGASDESIRAAAQRTDEIKKAYEHIRRTRGLL